MNADNALEAFAAISVGVAGFSAIVVALSGNTVVYDSRRLSWALGIIFSWSLGPVLFSVLPFILYFFGMTDSVVWRVGLLTMGSFVTVVSALILRRDHSLNEIGLGVKGKMYETPVKRSWEMRAAKLSYILTAAMLFAAGIWHPIPGYYLVGMTIMLALSLWVLMVVFFVIGFSQKQAD